MTLSMSGRDPMAQPKFEPIEMPLGKHIDKHVKKLEKTENIEQLLLLVISVSAMLGAQGKIVSRQSLAELLPEIKKHTKISAATWNSRTVYVLAAIGAAASIIGAGAAAFGTFNAVTSTEQITRHLMNEIGTTKLTDIIQQTASTQISNTVQGWQSFQGGCSAVGQAFNAGKEGVQNSNNSDRQLEDFLIESKKFKRDNVQQAVGSHSHKSDEATQLLKDVAEKSHRAKTDK
jgi:hypothetical protein